LPSRHKAHPVAAGLFEYEPAVPSYESLLPQQLRQTCTLSAIRASTGRIKSSLAINATSAVFSRALSCATSAADRRPSIQREEALAAGNFDAVNAGEALCAFELRGEGLCRACAVGCIHGFVAWENCAWTRRTSFALINHVRLYFRKELTKKAVEPHGLAVPERQKKPAGQGA